MRCIGAIREPWSTPTRCRRSAGSRSTPDALGVDLLSLSAHKVYGPKGVGALWVRHGVAIAAQSTGGGQERNRRSATENVAGIVGFAAAAELAERRARRGERSSGGPVPATGRRRSIAQVPDAIDTGAGGHDRGRVRDLRLPGVRSDVLLAALDMAGVEASAGSACASGAPLPVARAPGDGLPGRSRRRGTALHHRTLDRPPRMSMPPRR